MFLIMRVKDTALSGWHWACKKQEAALGIVADTPHPPEAERSMSG